MLHFRLSEFDCKETGANRMCPAFLEALDALRGVCGFAFVINSGYRSALHTAERHKDRPGMHTKGLAADIKVTGSYERYRLIQKALEAGFTGIGVASDFIHLDKRTSTPVMWVY